MPKIVAHDRLIASLRFATCLIAKRGENRAGILVGDAQIAE
jgi:hypothetical protein